MADWVINALENDGYPYLIELGEPPVFDINTLFAEPKPRNIWTLDSNHNNGYPYVSWQEPQLLTSVIYTQHDAVIQVLEHQTSPNAEAGTNETTIKITGHGLATDDFITNVNRRSTDQFAAERGSRRVTVVDADTLTVSPAISGQTDGDNIRLLKFVDRTDYLSESSLKINRKAEGQGDSSFVIVSPTDAGGIEYKVNSGQYVRIYIDGTLLFTGIAHTTGYNTYDESANVVFQTVNLLSLNNIGSRRTIKAEFDAGDTFSSIAEYLTGLLAIDGIEEGTITTTTETLGEAWTEDVITISDAFDEICSRTGFQWFIDKEFKLHFYQDPATIIDSSYQLVDGGVFMDYRNINVEESIDNYVNKVFTLGGDDENGNPIFLVNGDLDAQNAMQNLVGGSGIYNHVNTDVSNAEANYETAATDTSETSVFLTSAHNSLPGDMFWNYTRDALRIITDTPTTTSFTHPSITGQTEGDTIVFYPTANMVARNMLKRQKNIAKKITFDTFNINFEVQERVKVELARLDIPESYYNVEEISMQFTQKKHVRTTVTLVLRTQADFSTQKNPDFVDFFRGF